MGQQQRLLILNLSLKAATVLCLAGGNPRPVTTKTTTSVSNGFNLQPLSLHFSRLGTAASHTIPGLSQSAIIDGNPSFVQEEVTTTTQHLLATSSGENSLLLNPALPKDSTGVMVMTQPMYHPPPPHDEPSTWAKITRRMRVFLLAGRIFASYKTTKLQESFLRRRLGLSKENQNVDNNNDDHPAIVQLWDRAHERNANRILHAVEHLQGFWIKVGQYLSSRADVMPIQYLQTLSSLQDGVPAKPFQEIQQTLSEQFSTRSLQLFDSIDPNPLSTASIAQVHQATLVDGRKVVIKAQHRGVASLMLQDMENLRTILQLLATFEPDFDYNRCKYVANVTFFIP